MALSGLAALIYPILRERIRTSETTISYGALVDELGFLAPPNQNLQPFDQRLFHALGEIGAACHTSGLPALSSMVVQNQGTPGEGYYKATHPKARSEMQKLEAWSKEHKGAIATTYPESL